MRYLLLLTVFSFSNFLFSQKTIELFSSKKLNAEREIIIGLPKSYDTDTKKKYPLVFLLDGDYLFDPLYGTSSYTTYWDDLPEVIVVGISQNKNGERINDSFYNETSGFPDESGSQFYDFIGTELLPYLDKTYRTTPFKIIVGHDKTAGYSNFFLYKDLPLFNAYICLSPEFALKMKERISERLATIERPLFYYLATAEEDVKKFKEDSEELNEGLKKIDKPAFNYRFKKFEGSHYSFVLLAIPDALYYIFGSYQPITMIEFQEKIAVLDGNYVDYLEKKYDVIEKTFGIRVPIRINDFKAIETAIIKNKAYAEFEKLAILSKKSYPKSMLSDYHMGQFYENTGRTEKAIKTYLNALSKIEIGDLTKTNMYDRAQDLKNKE